MSRPAFAIFSHDSIFAYDPARREMLSFTREGKLARRASLSEHVPLGVNPATGRTLGLAFESLGDGMGTPDDSVTVFELGDSGAQATATRLMRSRDAVLRVPLRRGGLLRIEHPAGRLLQHVLSVDGATSCHSVLGFEQSEGQPVEVIGCRVNGAPQATWTKVLDARPTEVRRPWVELTAQRLVSELHLVPADVDDLASALRGRSWLSGIQNIVAATPGIAWVLSIDRAGSNGRTLTRMDGRGRVAAQIAPGKVVLLSATRELALVAVYLEGRAGAVELWRAAEESATVPVRRCADSWF